MVNSLSISLPSSLDFWTFALRGYVELAEDLMRLTDIGVSKPVGVLVGRNRNFLKQGPNQTCLTHSVVDGVEEQHEC